jgi:hypothetical protein
MQFADDDDGDCAFVMEITGSRPGPQRHSQEYFAQVPSLDDETDQHHQELGKQPRVEAYYGDDDVGVAHAALGACFKALDTPVQVRQLVNEALGAGPIPPEQRRQPDEEYRTDEGIRRAFTLFSMSIMGEPTGMILRLPHRILTLAAHGSQIFLVDHREQPSPPEAGQLPVLGGSGALVMSSRDVFEVERFVRARYELLPFTAEIYLAPAAATTTTATATTTPVDGPISKLSLEPDAGEAVNKEGKRERSPPISALGSPRRQEEPLPTAPKRAKTPPEPVTTAVKTEKRKSVPISARTAKTTSATPAAAAAKKEAETPAK